MSCWAQQNPTPARRAMTGEVGRYGRVVSTDAGEARAVPRAYLDSASGLPLHPAAHKVWEAAVGQGWADPLRLHTEGRTARLLLDNARAAVAEILHCRPDEVNFVGS